MKDIVFAKTGSTWNVEKPLNSFPYRAYDLIEFFKLCSQRQEIIGMTLDVENHTVELIFQVKEK